MTVVVLLIVALGFLVFGVMLTSVGLLATSLGVSLIAVGLLYRSRLLARYRRGPQTPAATVVWLVPGHGRYHRLDCATLVDVEPRSLQLDEARRQNLIACSLCRPEVPAGTN